MALIDDILNTVNLTLTTNLDWLNTAYGKAEARVKEVNNKEYRYPAIYTTDEQDNYRSMLPDSLLGNYCYWEIQDPASYQNIAKNIKPNFDFKLVFWFYWPDLYPSDWQDRSLDEVKAQILNVLVGSYHTNTIQVFEISEKADTIYSGFTHQEISRQFLMRPYGGLSIEGKIYGSTACSLDLDTPTIPPAIYPLLPFQYSLSEQVHPIMKWLNGEPIYWRTFSLGTGADSYEALTGLLTDSVALIVNTEHRFKWTSNGKWSSQTVPDLSHDSGTFEVFTLAGSEQNYVTVYYTKA